MNRIEEGKVYKAVRQRTGTSSSGEWELLVVADEKGNNELAIFTDNHPSGVSEGGSFRIEKILSVSYGNKKDANGVWRPNVSVNARVQPVFSYGEVPSPGEEPAPEVKEAFRPLPDDGDLPF